MSKKPMVSEWEAPVRQYDTGVEIVVKLNNRRHVLTVEAGRMLRNQLVDTLGPRPLP
jgi:hypothetical protein